MMNNNYDAKAAPVTGAASGIGAAVASQLARGGAKVVLADMDRDGSAVVEKAITSAGGQAAEFPLDVADAFQVDAMVTFAEQTFGGLHLAVNNAGIRLVASSMAEKLGAPANGEVSAPVPA